MFRKMKIFHPEDKQFLCILKSSLNCTHKDALKTSLPLPMTRVRVFRQVVLNTVPLLKSIRTALYNRG